MGNRHLENPPMVELGNPERKSSRVVGPMNGTREMRRSECIFKRKLNKKGKPRNGKEYSEGGL